MVTEVKREDALRMCEYRKRKQEDKASLDFMAFVTGWDLELFLEFHPKHALELQVCQEKSAAAQYEFDTSLLE